MRVERALVAHNTFVNCRYTFHIGLNHSSYPDGTAPLACNISNNILYQEKDVKNQLITYVKDQEPEKWIWQGNIYQGVLGIAPRGGLEKSSAFLKSGAAQLLLPTGKTPTAGRAGSKRDELTVDLASQARPENSNAGAFQYRVKQNRAMPLEAKDVGLLAGKGGKK
jgi:hypothetical protein